jgi:tRNA A22 N-methylase
MMSSSKKSNKLSKRLQFIKSFDHQSVSVWDIGCDHGDLGLSFIDCSWVEEINLVDPSIRVIEDLKDKVRDSYITNPFFSKIKIINSFGQELKLCQKKKTLFIAGMGGKEMGEILTHLISQISNEDRVVISPHRKVLELRELLMELDMRLIHEEVLQEGGQFYPLLVLSIDPKNISVSKYGEAQFWGTPDGLTYKDHQIRFFSKHSDPRSKAYVEFLKSLSY